jgi:carbon monoxide dehydrogenase subunit G
MVRTLLSRTIAAPLEKVFDTVAHIENFSKVVPNIIKVEFLSDRHSGVGTRFRETRRMGKREASTELEVTEFVQNDHVRFVSNAGGIIWDTVFTTTPASGGGVQLNMVMNAEAYKLLAKVINPLIKGMVQKAIARDMDAVKAYCEGTSARTPPESR